MAFFTKDQNGERRELEANALTAGLGVTQTGKDFEVKGAFVCRGSSEKGGRAIGIVADEKDGIVQGSIWTNAAYDPENDSSGWTRTINLVNGNVGIGDSKDLVAIQPSERLVVAGSIVATGDVRLEGADCAEEFTVDTADLIEPGTVLVIGHEETLQQCEHPYDTRVAGVVSGAGQRGPGIVLGKRAATASRMPIALTGTVYCKVDASYDPVAIGDLLTTSSTPGHAMKVTEHVKAHGAVLGKALRPLRDGRGLIPVLVCLH